MWDSTRGALWQGAARCALGVALLVLGLAGCSKEKVVLGEQCPSPGNPSATVERGPMDAGEAVAYGTSCAPLLPATCADTPPKLDARGCIVYVTFESCGGDICAGAARLTRLLPDAGDGDAGDELSVTEDGGAGP